MSLHFSKQAGHGSVSIQVDEEYIYTFIIQIRTCIDHLMKLLSDQKLYINFVCIGGIRDINKIKLETFHYIEAKTHMVS